MSKVKSYQALDEHLLDIRMLVNDIRDGYKKVLKKAANREKLDDNLEYKITRSYHEFSTETVEILKESLQANPLYRPATPNLKTGIDDETMADIITDVRSTITHLELDF